MKRGRSPSRAVAVATLGLSLICLSLPASADESTPAPTPTEEVTPPPAPTPDPPPAPTPDPPPAPTPDPPPAPTPDPPPAPTPDPPPAPTPDPPPSDPAPNPAVPAPGAPAPAPGSADARVVLPPTVSRSGALVDADGNGSIDAGDRLEVTYSVTNPSSLPMSDISLSPTGGDATVSCAGTSLAPGASMTCVGRVRVTQADVDARAVSFPRLTARGVVSDDRVSTSVPGLTLAVAARPALSASQRVSFVRDRNQDGRVGQGDGLAFRLDVVNTGNVTVSNLSVEDDLLSRWNQAMSCTVGRLAPGARTTCSSDVLNVTLGMVQGGSLTNTAVAVGSAPGGQQVRSAKTVTTTPLTRNTGTGPQPNTPDEVKPIRKLNLSQYLSRFDDVNGNGALTEGETLTFAFRVTNKGTVALNRLTILDARLQDLGVNVTCGRSSLEPGAVTSCASAPVRVTQAMGRIGHGFGTNFAHAVAFDASSVSVRSNSTQVSQGYFANELQQGGALASTGADVNALLLGGGLAVVLGGVAIGVARRREETTE